MQIDIYQFDLTKPNLNLNSAYNLLDTDEQQKSDRFVIKDVREKFIFSHALLRQVLAQNLNKTPESLQYHYNSNGKPGLKNHQLHFNLSHSGDLVLMGLCREAEIGVDVEHARGHDNYQEIAERFFTKTEVAELKTLDDFYRIWTRKEAYLKMLGHGITFGLDKFSVSAKKDGLDCLISAEENLIKNCYLGSLKTEENYFAAFCVENKSKLEVHYKRF